MRENRTSGSMSGSEKPGHGRATEALPQETGSQRIGPAYHHGARVRLYPTGLGGARVKAAFLVARVTAGEVRCGWLTYPVWLWPRSPLPSMADPESSKAPLHVVSQAS